MHRNLQDQGWNPARKNVIVIHGFNGTESKTPMTFIRDGELQNHFICSLQTSRYWFEIIHSAGGLCLFISETKFAGIYFAKLFSSVIHIVGHHV